MTVSSSYDRQPAGRRRRVARPAIQDALGAAGIIRYRARISNEPSLAIARSLGFAGYGQNLIARRPGGQA